jgi:type I restriction enzyme S subunit
MWDKRPKDWATIRLSDIAQRIVRKRDGDEHPIMMISAKSGFILQSQKYSREMAGKSLLNYTLLKEGEFAYNKGNSQTSPQGCVYPLHVPSALVPNIYYCFRLGQDIDPEFGAHAFQAGVLNRELARAINSGVRNDGLLNLSSEDFFRCGLSLPNLFEQKSIAEVLSALKLEIARTNDLIAALGFAKYATMRELLTLGVRRQKSKLKKLPKRWVLGRVAQGIEAIPSDWDLVTLTSVAKLESGHTPSRSEPSYWGDDVSWLSLGDTDALDALVVTDTAEKVSHKGLANSSARLLPVDTVIFSRTATVGKATRLATPMATSQDFANWICGPEMNPRYLVQVFRHMQREWQRLQEGSTHQTIYMPVFQKLQVLKPPLPEQIKIADIGDSFDVRIAAERAELTRLIECRAALAQELLSGRVRLPEAMIARHRDKPGKAA